MSGRFQPPAGVTSVRVLVVGGGGSGYGGGGGSGYVKVATVRVIGPVQVCAFLRCS